MRTARKYELGDLVRVVGTFSNTETGAVTDPATVICSYKNPAGVTTELTYGVSASVVRDSIGRYHTDVDANASGRWFYRWHSTGLGQAADEGEFYVKPSPFT